jgi:hypothetical protein
VREDALVAIEHEPDHVGCCRLLLPQIRKAHLERSFLRFYVAHNAIVLVFASPTEEPSRLTVDKDPRDEVLQFRVGGFPERRSGKVSKAR